MSRQDWEHTLDQDLARLRDQHLFRRRHVVTPHDATHVEVDGRRYVNFASNNYLGLTHHPRVIAAVERAARDLGAGSGAAPLITGYGPAHQSAERRIAAWKQSESAVLLPSGYQANVAAIQALAAIGERTDIASGAGTNAGGTRFLLDKLAHASLIDAIRSTAAPYRVFPHNHLAKLYRLLAEADPRQLQVVVTESIFSMDGDAADLAGLAELKSRRPFVLLLDEAHASGVYGPAGAGLAAELGLAGVADVTVVTLSKALGSAGGAVCASAALCDAVVNFGRAYVYSTHLPPSAVAAAEAAIDVMADEPQRQQRVRELSARVRTELRAKGVALPPGDSPIVPITLGSERAALEAARALQDQGLWVLAIRPPTVPRGTSRLRVTLSSEHHDEEVAQLIAALASFR
jgi:8-amino-7-oxononanoate synthase